MLDTLSEFANEEQGSKILGRMLDQDIKYIKSENVNSELQLSNKFSEESIRVVSFYIENHPKCPKEIKDSKFPSQFFFQFKKDNDNVIKIDNSVFDVDSGKELKFVGVDTLNNYELYRLKDCSDPTDSIDYSIKPRNYGDEKPSFLRKIRNFLFNEN